MDQTNIKNASHEKYINGNKTGTQDKNISFIAGGIRYPANVVCNGFPLTVLLKQQGQSQSNNVNTKQSGCLNHCHPHPKVEFSSGYSGIWNVLSLIM